MVSGIVFLDKPRGWSSRRAVNEVARLFGGNRKPRLKAGHAGTLDPMATGMLPILLGEATRFAELGLNAEKTYAVTIDLSYQTDTLDAEGETLVRFTDGPSLAQVEAVLGRFRGAYEQVPPQYSALRVEGRRAHALARKGESFTLAARPVEIRELLLVRYAWPELMLEVRCSKGTYIRALARDIGDALDVGGCVVQLRRLSTGGWPESMMVTPEQLLAERREEALVPISTWLKDLPAVRLDPEQSRRFLLGQRLRIEGSRISNGLVTTYGDGILLGTAELRPGDGEYAVLHPGRILPSAQERYLR